MQNPSRRGIILAGGSGTRLYPITQSVSKQLLPVYDKPMIYYPLSVLMLADIREILMISTPRDVQRFEELLGDGRRWGLELSYAVQSRPEGVADAFLVARDFAAGRPSAVILGDNIFYGQDLSAQLRNASARGGATIFAYAMDHPQAYGVVEFDASGKPLSIEEKPESPKSRFAVTGLYFFDERAMEFASMITPSQRGEREIASLLNRYMQEGLLHVDMLGRGMMWIDAGTHDALLEASSFIQTIEKRQGLKICCPEELAFRCGMIDAPQLRALAAEMGPNSYGKYLISLLDHPDDAAYTQRRHRNDPLGKLR
jgi:glucose-1-phosphate thymidylyltransferase